MTFVTYYTDLLASGSIGGYITLGLVAIALLIMLVQAVLAYGRGTSRSMMRLITVAVAAVLAFIVTRILGRAFLPDVTLETYLPLPVPALRPLMDANASLVLLPLLFVALFLFFSLLMLIVHKLFCGILGFSYARNNIFTRLFAIVVGLVQGVLLSIILALPLFNVCALYGDAAAAEEAESSVVSVYENYLEATEKSPICEYTMKFGGEWLFAEFEAATTEALPKE